MRVKNDLRAVDRAAYDECLEFVVREMPKTGLVSAILQFGTVHFPGISDLDLVIITKNNDAGDIEKINTAINKAPHADYFFHHAPTYALPRDIPYLKLFHSVENLQPLWGDIPRDLPDDYKELRILAWNSYFYRAALECVEQPEVSQRYVLLLLNNIRTSITQNDDLGSTKYGEDYRKKVAALRQKSLDDFALDISEEAEALVREGLAIFQKQEDVLADKKSLSRFAVYDKTDRNVFVRGPKIGFKVRGKYRFFTFPSRYFRGRAATKQLVAKLGREGISRKEFEDMRDRLGSVKILDY